MPDEPQRQRRPQGELMVEFRKPVMHFGVELVMGIRGLDGSVWVAHTTESGDLMYIAQQSGTDVLPLLNLTEEEASAIYRVVNNMPVRFRGDATVEHLADAIQMRDRLFELHEEVLKRHFKEL